MNPKYMRYGLSEEEIERIPPKLAPGHENLMWSTEATIEKVAKIGVEALEATKSRKKLKAKSDGLGSVKRVEVDIVLEKKIDEIE